MDGNLYSKIRDDNEPQYGPRGANPLPEENSSWHSLAKIFNIGELDLDEFAFGMKFKGFKDLEISISPKELYKRDPKRFVEVLQTASAKASHMSPLEISDLIEKEVLGESKVNEYSPEYFKVGQHVVDAEGGDYTIVRLVPKEDGDYVEVVDRWGNDKTPLLYNIKDIKHENMAESKVNENVEGKITPVYVVLMPLGKDTTLEDVYGEYTDAQGLVNLINGSRNDLVGIYSDKNLALKKAQELVATAQKEQWQYWESVNSIFDMTKDIIEEGNYSLNIGDKVRTYKGTTGEITKIEKWFSGHKVTVKMDNTGEEKVWQDNDLGVIEEAIIAPFLKLVEEKAFSDEQIGKLRGEYEKINTIDPSQGTYEKLASLLDSLDLETLKQLAGANVKFISKLAANRVSRMEHANEALDPMAQHDEDTKNVLATIASLRQQLEALQGKGAEVERAEVYGPVFRALDSLERSFRRYH